MQNPLLETQFLRELPDFNRIEAQHFIPAIEEITQGAKEKIDTLVAQAKTPNWQQVFYPVESILDQLHQVWSVISHLNAVTNTAEIRDAYAGCLPKLTAFYTWLGQHSALFEATQTLKSSEQFARLTAPRQKIIDNKLRDFRLSGIALNEDDKARYAQIQEQLSALTTRFSNNVLDATQAYSLHIDSADEVKGLPPMAMEAAAELAVARGLEGYVFTLDAPSYLPFMQYCENRGLRQQMYEAYVTRASGKGPDAGAFDNTELIEQILDLRLTLAKLLGFTDYVDYSLVTKMAGDYSEVHQFLMNLAGQSVEPAREEYANLQQFAAQSLDIAQLEAWDVPFAAEKLREEQFAVSQEILKPYFPADQVIDGMFDIVRRLYGIRVEATPLAATWHQDIRFYSVFDANENLLAQFYLDLFAREGKRGGAWMADCKSRRLLDDGSTQLPVAFLVCNFTPPTRETPSLLTHTDVTTMFHEFGHGLHHMLTVIDDAEVAGISGVPWDAVELPSQFLENWCWEAEAVAMISGHYQTGEALPKELLDKLLAAKNFQSAMQMVRQLEFALFDMEVHHQYGRPAWQGVQAVLDGVREQVAAYPVPPVNCFQNSFTHIFAGGYAAGYYSYKWAEVLSADAYSVFEEQGVFDQEAGQRFYQTILARGGSDDPAVLFREFRGRDATVDALLRHSGIVKRCA